MSLKMYVLIWDQMDEAQQAVQAGHALAQFGLEHPREFKAWQENGNVLIYLNVRDIAYWETVLEDGEFTYSKFHEPELRYIRDSLDGRYWTTREADTAIAVGPDWVAQYILFKDLPPALQPKPEPKRWWQRG